MSLDSKIQWTDHTWNIAVGCSKVDSDCKYCYMYRGSLNEKRYNPKVVRKTKTVFKLPLKIKEPSKIFTSSLTGLQICDGRAFQHKCLCGELNLRLTLNCLRSTNPAYCKCAVSCCFFSLVISTLENNLKISLKLFINSK